MCSGHGSVRLHVRWEEQHGWLLSLPCCSCMQALARGLPRAWEAEGGEEGAWGWAGVAATAAGAWGGSARRCVWVCDERAAHKAGVGCVWGGRLVGGWLVGATPAWLCT